MTWARSREPLGRGTTEAITVLAVDDEPGLAEMTAQFLERHDDDLSVLTETSPQTALDRLETTRVDCIVSDYQMPAMDGIAFLKAVREDYPELPFILYTGKGSEAIASEAISAGVTDYLQKGTGGEEYGVLAQQVRNNVERRWAVERFEEYLESAPDATVIVEFDGDIAELNSRACELFGYAREQLVGEPIEVLLPDRYREAHVGHRERYMQSPETRPMGADLELYALKADGTEFPVDVAISPIRVGGHVEVMAAVRDISDRRWREEALREREAALERQNERLEEFASIVSHDLQNPLTVARGNLELAHEAADPDAFLEEAEAALDRMSSLTEDLLELAREGETVAALDHVDLEAVARDAWRTADVGDATLVVASTTDVAADRGRLRELFENLFHNSVQHGAKGTDGAGLTVTVSVTDDGFLVDDDGTGLTSGARERAFEYGYSGSGGTGLGLAIVQRIAEAHGWRVDVESSPAGGARVVVSGVDHLD